MKSKSLLVLVAAIVTGACGCGGGPSSPRSTLAITMISPTSAPAGGGAFVLAVQGTTFVPGSVINFGSMPITSAYSCLLINPQPSCSATQLSATVPAAAITTVGTVPVTVTNPAGGGTSNAVNFTITSGPYPEASITSINPTGALAGGPGFTLELIVTNFLAGSVVRWNGSDRPTTASPPPSCVPACGGWTIEAQIPASDIAAPGTAAITVFNQAPGAGSSNPVTFAIAAHGVYPSSVAVDPAGKFAYVTNSGSDNVSTYAINTDGTLTFKGTIAAGGNPASVAVDPSDRFAYVASIGDGSVLGSVSMYTINADGLLTSIGTINEGYGTQSVTVHPSGKFAYVTNFSPGNVSTYAINTDGTLTFKATIAAGTEPASVAVDRSGKFAYVANRGGGWDSDPSSISMYTIDTTTGALSLNGTLSPTTWVNPSVVVVDPSGRFAYLGSTPVSMYSIDTTTGTLTPIGTVDAGGFVTSLTVHPSGNFAYATANCTPDFPGLAGICDPVVSPPHVSVYTLNATTGVLASNGTAPTEQSPRSIAIDPSGKFAYVANYNSHSVSMYTIDAVTGTLTLIGTVGT